MAKEAVRTPVRSARAASLMGKEEPSAFPQNALKDNAVTQAMAERVPVTVMSVVVLKGSAAMRGLVAKSAARELAVIVFSTTGLQCSRMLMSQGQ